MRWFTKKSKVPKKQFNKETSNKKETLIEEKRSYGSEDFVDPEYDTASYTQVQRLYDTSSLLKKYIRAITDEIKRYPIVAKPIQSKENDKVAQDTANNINRIMSRCNGLEGFDTVREKYIKDLFLYGRAGIEIEPNTPREFKALYPVPGYCIRLNVDDTGYNFLSQKEAYKVVDPENLTKVVAKFNLNSFIFMTLDPMSDRVYGSDPITSIYTDLSTDLATSKNVQAGTNALKAGVICLPKASNRVLNSVVENLTRLVKRNSRTKVVSVNSSGNFLDLSNLSPEDNISLQKWLFKKANVWNIPLFKIGVSDDTGSLNAREQMAAFREMIESIVKSEINQLNAVLLYAKLELNDIEFTCPNFATKLDYERARIAVRLVNGKIITPNEAREKYLGLNRINDSRADSILFNEKEGTSDSVDS